MKQGQSARAVSVLKFVLFVATGIVLLFYSFSGVSVKGIIYQMLQSRWPFLSLSFLISLAALFVRAYRWRKMIEASGYSSSIPDVFTSLSVGYLANLAFPRLGEVSRCTALYRRCLVPVHVSLGTVVAERVIDVLCLFISFILLLLVEFNRIGNFIMDSVVNPIRSRILNMIQSPWYLAVLMIALLVLFFLIRKLLYAKQLKAANYLKGFWNGVLSVRQVKSPFLFIVLSVTIWALYFLAVYVGFSSLQFTDRLGGSTALFLLVAGGIAMSAPVQGGIGAYHILVSQGLILYGLSKEQGLVFATLMHGTQLVLIIVLGLPALAFVFFRKASTTVPREQKEEVMDLTV